MEHYAPWKEHLDELEAHHAIPQDQLPFYVIYQDVSGQWRVQAGNNDAFTFSLYFSWIF